MRSVGVEQKVFGDKRFEVELVVSGLLPPTELTSAAMTIAFCGDRVLLVRLADRDWHPPGGRREPGETARETAVREAQEEAGVAVRELVAIGYHRFTALDPMPVDHPYPVPTVYQVYFVGRVDDDAVPEAGTEAVEACLCGPDVLAGTELALAHGALLEEAQRRASAPTMIRPNGEPMAADLPGGCQAAVLRPAAHGWETLILHRVGASAEGPWSWGAPTGARHPGEDPDECAARELHEETGLSVPLRRLPDDPEGWYWYTTTIDADAEIVLSVEHDAYEWVSLTEAKRRSQPEACGTIFAALAATAFNRDAV